MIVVHYVIPYNSQFHFNQDVVENVLKDVFIDWPPLTHKGYRFTNPPKIDGQFGMPVIVDNILGIVYYIIEIIKMEGFCNSKSLMY